MIAFRVVARRSSTPPPAAAPQRPAVGTRVILQRDDRLLRERHGAPRGTVGTVIAHSRLSADDDGVLIDWGDGEPVRANLDEFSPTLPGEHVLIEKPRYARGVLYDGLNLDAVHALAGDIEEPPIGAWVVVDADGHTHIHTPTEAWGLYDRREATP